jgi:hypothetical protein
MGVRQNSIGAAEGSGQLPMMLGVLSKCRQRPICPLALGIFAIDGTESIYTSYGGIVAGTDLRTKKRKAKTTKTGRRPHVVGARLAWPSL